MSWIPSVGHLELEARNRYCNDRFIEVAWRIGTERPDNAPAVAFQQFVEMAKGTFLRVQIYQHLKANS